MSASAISPDDEPLVQAPTPHARRARAGRPRATPRPAWSIEKPVERGQQTGDAGRFRSRRPAGTAARPRSRRMVSVCGSAPAATWRSATEPPHAMNSPDHAGQHRQDECSSVNRLTHQSHSAGAKSRSHRELRPACRRARQHEAGDVRTGNQQDEPHIRPEQQPERTLGRRADHAIGPADPSARRSWRWWRVLTAQPRGNRVHFGACRFDGGRPSPAGRGRLARPHLGSASSCHCGPKKSGCQSWISAVGSSNSGGMTPTISTFMSLNSTVRPTMRHLAPKRCCQRPWLMTTACGVAGVGRAVFERPAEQRRGAEQLKEARSDLSHAWTRSAPAPRERAPCELGPVVYSAICSKALLRSFQSRKLR